MNTVDSAFTFDPLKYKQVFSDLGYVHIKDGVAPELIDFAWQQTEGYRVDQTALLPKWEIKNKKTQYLFEFPSHELARNVIDVIAAVTSLPSEHMMMSERHIKDYSPNAQPRPSAHKDRFQSQVSVGIPLHVPNGSAVVLWPDQSRTVNTFDSTREWRDNLEEKELPENVLKDIDPLVLDVRVGDLIIFLGSAIYHERINAAGTVLLYFKFNAKRLDPMAEDPFAELQREASLEILARSSAEELLSRAVEVSPRLLRVRRDLTRNNWRPVLQACMAGDTNITITESDLKIIKKMNPMYTLQEVLVSHRRDEPRLLRKVAQVRQLGEVGILDFLNEPIRRVS